MEINRRLFRITLVLLFLGLTPFLCAQTAGYHIDTQTGEPRFIQRLAWRGGENALRYEVVIQRETNGFFRDHLREFTTELFIEVSLSPGNYRFRVIPYDVLNKSGDASEWKDIEVLHARKPEVLDTKPEAVMGRRNKHLGYTLDILGNDIEPDAEIIIRRPDGSTFTPEKVEYEDDNIIRLNIEKDIIEQGEYEIIIINPGGLETSMGGILFDKPQKESKPLGIMAGAAWAPLTPIYGEAFGGDFSTVGASIRVSKVFNMPFDMCVGPELTASMYSLNMIACGINLLAQKKISFDRIAINFRLGGDYVFPSVSSELNVNMGVSLFIPLFNMFFLEAGLDYSNLFSSSYDVSSGNLRTWIGFGVQF